MHLHRLVAAILLAVLLPFAALAQTPPAPVATAIEFKPLIDALLYVAAMAIMVLGGIAVRRLTKWLGVKNDVEIQKLAEPILQNALAFGQAATGQMPHSVDAKNAIVATAANYAIQALADTLKKVDRAHVENMLLARLEANVSAQTPEVTATAAAPLPTTVSKPPETPASTPTAP